ncbi:hypothetical protein BHE74_00018316 [Ensete ventricosum]|nr:hypothetical protein BHE74_00018316 [Ensete ventricosum]
MYIPVRQLIDIPVCLSSHNCRTRDQVHPLVVAMEFCSENILVCGSDCEYSGSAVVQLWDIESAGSCLSFTANDSYITSLKVNPAGNTIITGALCFIIIMSNICQLSSTGD